MYRLSILIIFQRDATQRSLFIIMQVHCTCFGCQPHPSSGVNKTVTTASGNVQLPPSNVVRLAWPRWREVAAQKVRPVHKTVTTASGNVQLPPSNVAKLACVLLMMGVVDTRNMYSELAE